MIWTEKIVVVASLLLGNRRQEVMIAVDPRIQGVEGRGESRKSNLRPKGFTPIRCQQRHTR